MKLRVTAAMLLLLAWPLSTSRAAGEPFDPGREIARLRIVNDCGGEIAASADRGASWKALGHTLRYTTQVNTGGYTASKWVSAGRVAATAVNAIHVNVGLNTVEDRGIIFSILPQQLLAPPKEYRSFLSPDSSIYTDIPAGEGIFGGGYAPFVGNPVYLRSGAGDLVPVTAGYVPRRGDELVIVVLRPEPYPISVEFENQEGGSIRLRYLDGRERQLGYVVRPVRGVGRFEGALYTGIGRIRANHAGVIDVSTSPVGSLGAFQIIPFGHSISPEMSLAWERTQWMIVGPVTEVGQSSTLPHGGEEKSPLWEGLTPLFCGYLRPDYLPGDLEAPEWESRLLARFLVDVETGDGWRPMLPRQLAALSTAALPEWADHALDEITKVRILFPMQTTQTGAPGG